MTGETSTRNSGYTNAFSYDGGTSTGAGNPTSFKGTSHTYNSNNQLSDTGYAYDGNGNPTTYKTTTLTFDAENRMTSYGTALTNGYRGDGLRAWKQGTGSKTYFLYDGEQVIGEFNSSGTYANLYTFGANGLVSQRNVAAGATNFYTFDLQGNIAETLHADQTQNGAWRFDAYGGTGTAGPFVAGAPYANFGGQWGYYSDVETGLELLTHRFYDRSTGRFITRDPIGYEGGVNLYGYTGNDPVNRVDELGDNWLKNTWYGLACFLGFVSFCHGGVPKLIRPVDPRAPKYKNDKPSSCEDDDSGGNGPPSNPEPLPEPEPPIYTPTGSYPYPIDDAGEPVGIFGPSGGVKSDEPPVPIDFDPL